MTARLRVRASVNLASSALTFASLNLPWIRYNTGETLSPIRNQDAWVAGALIVSGGIIVLLTRYGGLLTMTGVWLFVASPPRFLFPGAPYNAAITSSFETGVWLAWASATVSLLGGSWTLPFDFRSKSDRKILAKGMFPAGVIVFVFGLLFSLVLSLFGLILAGTGLTLLLSQGEIELFSRIRKAVGTIRSSRRRNAERLHES